MANNATRIQDQQVKNNADGTDQLLGHSTVSNADVIIPVSNLYTNTTLKVANLVFMNNTTPVNSTQNVVTGTIWYDASYFYIAVANNITKRVALISF